MRSLRSGLTLNQRNDLNAVRTAAPNSSGRSHTAKCPPVGTSLRLQLTWQRASRRSRDSSSHQYICRNALRENPGLPSLR